MTQDSVQIETNEGIAVRRFPVVLHAKEMVIHLLPKNASTSIEKAVRGLNPEYKPLSEVCALPYKKVVVVRNPFDRLVSCWENKINDPVGNATWAKRFIEPIGLPAGTPFKEWALRVCLQPDEYSDRHYRSQVAQISLNGVLVPDTIIKLEDGTLWEDLGIKPFPQTMNKTSHMPYQEYYDEELIKAVGIRYAEDLYMFGYSYDN